MKDLIERLEKATEGSRELDLAVAQAVDGPWHYTGEPPRRIFCAAYTTSLDAALTLVPEGYSKDMAECPENGAVVRVYFGPIRENSAGEPTGRANTLPLALCIAALKARSEA
jgi:hypothetical protein